MFLGAMQKGSCSSLSEQLYAVVMCLVDNICLFVSLWHFLNYDLKVP